MPPLEIVKSLQNQHIKEAIALHTNKQRLIEEACLVVGDKAIHEAKEAGWQAKRYFFRDDILTPESFSEGKPWQMVSNTVLKALADTVSAPPVVAIFELPPSARPLPLPLPLEKLPCPQSPNDTLLVLDGIQDPGNLGTLFRTAVAFGVTQVVLIQPSADAYASKVIRASTGLQFRLAIYTIRHEETSTVLERLTQKGWHPYLADAFEASQKSPLYLHDLQHLPEHNMAVVLGQEGQGLRLNDSEKQPFSSLSVAMCDEVDSLNVAMTGGLILHHLYGIKRRST